MSMAIVSSSAAGQVPEIAAGFPAAAVMTGG